MGVAHHLRSFGLSSKVALCAHSQFGYIDIDTGQTMRAAMAILDSCNLDFEYEVE